MNHELPEHQVDPNSPWRANEDALKRIQNWREEETRLRAGGCAFWFFLAVALAALVFLYSLAQDALALLARFAETFERFVEAVEFGALK